MHCNIALALSRNINRSPDKKINSVYSKMLLMLDLPEDQSVLEEIFAILDEAREVKSNYFHCPNSNNTFLPNFSM